MVLVLDWIPILIFKMDVITVVDLILWTMMNIMTIIMENLLLTLGDIVDNLFHYHIFNFCLYALARDESVHFYFIIAVLFCAVANRVSHLTRFHLFSSEIGKSDTNKNSKYVV